MTTFKILHYRKGPSAAAHLYNRIVTFPKSKTIEVSSGILIFKTYKYFGQS